MENETTTALAYSGFIISLLTAFIGAVNHKRIRSTCCKKELEASIDIENTTPPQKSESDLKIKISSEKYPIDTTGA